MNLFWKILKSIAKFAILFICSGLITFFSAKIPIAGIDPPMKIPIINVELYSLAGSSCGDMPVGLPLAYSSKYKKTTGLLENAMICSNPGRILRRLIMFFSDIIFWLIFLYLAINFWEKFINFPKLQKSIHAK